MGLKNALTLVAIAAAALGASWLITFLTASPGDPPDDEPYLGI